MKNLKAVHHILIRYYNSLYQYCHMSLLATRDIDSTLQHYQPC